MRPVTRARLRLLREISGESEMVSLMCLSERALLKICEVQTYTHPSFFKEMRDPSVYFCGDPICLFIGVRSSMQADMN